MAKKEYTADSIKVLKFPADIRKRTSMYLGEEDQWATRCLVEILDNALDEARAKYAKTIRLIVDGNRFIVFDDGRGIPTEKHKATGNPAIQTVFDTIHAGGKFDTSNYDVSAGTNGTGASAVNAVSSFFRAYSFRNGWKSLHFAKGILKKKLHSEKLPYKWKQKGSVVEFELDKSIVKSEVDLKYIVKMLKFSAYLIPKLKIEYINKNKKVNKVYCSKTGLSGYLDKKVNTLNSEQLTTAFHFDSKFCSCHFEFVKSDDSLIETYVNGARTLEDGNHLVGFKKVLHAIVQERANKKDSDFKPDDIIDGLVLVLNVNIPDAKFQSQVKDKLTTRDAIDWVYDALYKDLKKWGSSNASAIKEIIVRANLSRKAKLDWEQTRKAVLAVKGKRGKTSLPSSRKFAISTGKDINKRELYVVEGDSAASSCRSARDPKYQEILALRGKILNAEKDKGSKLYQSQEVINILQAIGISADGNKYRVGKIIITSDADPDGAHIDCLVLTLLYKLAPDLFKKGMVYRLDAPLFIGKTDTKNYYADSLNSLKKMAKSFKTITRAKGLGELDADLLRDIGFKDDRNHIQITLADAKGMAKAMKIMGDDVNERKKLLSSMVK